MSHAWKFLSENLLDRLKSFNLTYCARGPHWATILYQGTNTNALVSDSISRLRKQRIINFINFDLLLSELQRQLR